MRSSKPSSPHRHDKPAMKPQLSERPAPRPAADLPMLRLPEPKPKLRKLRSKKPLPLAQQVKPRMRDSDFYKGEGD